MAPMLLWEGQIRQHLVLGVIQQLCHTWKALAELVGDAAPLLASSGGIRLDKDRADRRSDHSLGTLGHQTQHIPHEMRSATLPARSLNHRGDGSLEALVTVADDQLHPGQATCHQCPEEPEPEGAVLTGTD